MNELKAETLITLWQSWENLMMQPLDGALWKENYDIIVIII